MTDEEMKAELEKCLADPRYFYNTYWQVDGKPVTPISQEEWDKMQVSFYFGGRGGRKYQMSRLINHKLKNNERI